MPRRRSSAAVTAPMVAPVSGPQVAEAGAPSVAVAVEPAETTPEMFSVDEMRRLRRLLVRSEPGTFKCPNCSEEFYVEGNLNSHVGEQHGTRRDSPSYA